MKRVTCEFEVPLDVQDKMTAAVEVVKFEFFDPTDVLVRLLALSPIGARPENMAFFPEASPTLHDFCHGDRLRRMHESMPTGAAVLTAVLFFDEINRDAKGFASGDGAIIVGGFFRQRVRESTYSKASLGTFPQMSFPKVRHATVLCLRSFVINVIFVNYMFVINRNNVNYKYCN
jgi:hypothetical protein